MLTPILATDALPNFTQLTLNELDMAEEEVVKVSCIRALQEYMKALPAATAGEYQRQVVAAISKYISEQNMEELKESGDDLLDTLVETLRDAIMAAPEQCLDHPALDVLFTLASQGANSFATSMLVNEAFEVSLFGSLPILFRLSFQQLLQTYAL